MPSYQCPRCHYETCKKSHIRTHYNRKRVCKPLFSRKSVKDCMDELEKPKDDKIMIDRESYEKMQNEIEQLRQTQAGHHNTTINRDQINNTINININDFKNTNYQIALEDLRNSIRQSLLKNNHENKNIECENLIELVHCNDKYPENQNILLTDRSRGEVKVKQGDKLVNMPMEDAIEKTTDNIINLLKDNSVFTRYIDFHEKKDEDIQKEDKKAIERILYNNRHKIGETLKVNGIK